jgi:hypothetical protein
VQASRLADILCHREQRHLSQQLALAYDRRQIILERSELADKLAASTSRSTTSLIGRSRCDGKGTRFPIPSSSSAAARSTITPPAFSKDQRISHTAIVENKRLSHALATVKAQQDIKHMPTARPKGRISVREVPSPTPTSSFGNILYINSSTVVYSPGVGLDCNLTHNLAIKGDVQFSALGYACNCIRHHPPYGFDFGALSITSTSIGGIATNLSPLRNRSMSR